MQSEPQLKQAVEVVQGGGVIAYPTEYCFGLGCDPSQPLAVQRVLDIKRRAADQGVILIAGSVGQLRTWLSPTLFTDDKALLDEARATWPGPVTWLLPPSRRVHRLVRGRHPTVAVRVTRHPLAASLCLACEMPLVSTSANRHGQSPARTEADVQLLLGDDVDFVLPGLVGGARAPSEVREAGTGRVLRAGQ